MTKMHQCVVLKSLKIVNNPLLRWLTCKLCAIVTLYFFKQFNYMHTILEQLQICWISVYRQQQKKAGCQQKALLNDGLHQKHLSTEVLHTRYSIE